MQSNRTEIVTTTSAALAAKRKINIKARIVFIAVCLEATAVPTIPSEKAWARLCVSGSILSRPRFVNAGFTRDERAASLAGGSHRAFSRQSSARLHRVLTLVKERHDVRFYSLFLPLLIPFFLYLPLLPYDVSINFRINLGATDSSRRGCTPG